MKLVATILAALTLFASSCLAATEVVTPDFVAKGTINSATSNAAYGIPVAHGQAAVGFTVTGLTASGATLTVEDSSNGAANFYPSAGISPNTLTADGQYTVNVAGRDHVELVVTSTGSGTVTVSWLATMAAAAGTTSDPTVISGNVSLLASQNDIGNVGGKTVEACATPTVTATNSYGTNYVVGGLLHFTGVFTSTGTGIWQNVNVNMKKVESSGFTFVPFKSNPSTTTWTDASVAAINPADVDKVRPFASLTASSALGTHTNLSASNLAVAIAPGTTDLYGVLLSNATLTNQFAATTDVTSVCIEVLDDL